MNNFLNLINNKKSLLKCIFLTLLFQSITTFVVFYYLKDKVTDRLNIPMFLVIFFISLFVIFLLNDNNMPFYQKFLLFTIFSVLNGFILIYFLKFIPYNLIMSSLVSTIYIFTILFIVSLIITYLGFDLSFLFLSLIFLLIISIIISIVFIFIPPSEKQKRIYLSCLLILFMVFIVYDTNEILLRYKNNSSYCIRGALDYYLDILNIFKFLIRRGKN